MSLRAPLRCVRKIRSITPDIPVPGRQAVHPCYQVSFYAARAVYLVLSVWITRVRPCVPCAPAVYRREWVSDLDIWACGAHMLHKVRLRRHVSVSGYWSLLYVPRRALQLATSHRIHSNVNIIFSSVRNECDSVKKRDCRLSSTIQIVLSCRAARPDPQNSH